MSRPSESTRRKIGVFTSAVALIVVGIVVILHVTGPVSYSVFRFLWPVLLILFGAEAMWTFYRYRGAKIGVSVWSIVLLVVIGLSSAGIYGLKVFGTDLHFGPGYSEPVSGKVTIGSNIKRVVIELRNTPVTITGTASSTLSYNGNIKVFAATKAKADKVIHTEWKVKQTGDTLDVTLASKKPIIDLSLDGLLQSRPHLNLRVPRQLVSSVITTNGGIRVSHMNAPVQVQSTNGALNLESINGDVSAHTTNGSLHLQDLAKAVNVSTTNGSITGTSMVGGQWTCVSSNGSVRMTLKNHPSVKVTAATSNGHFYGNIHWQQSNPGNAAATMGSGLYVMTLRTTNGSVNINSQP